MYPLKKLVLLSVLLFLVKNCSAYDRARVAALLQEQAYPELLSLATGTPDAEQDAYLWNAAGYAAYQSSMPETAIPYFTRSLEKDSANVPALLYLGLIHKQHSCTTALPYFLRLTANKPGNARYYRYVSDCYNQLKQPDSAFRFLVLAYIATPTDPSVANAYADALVEQRKFIKADTVLQMALTAAPQNELLLATSIKSAYLQKHYKQILPLTDILIRNGNISYAPFFYALIAALQIRDYKRCIDLSGLLLAAGHETEQVLYYTAQAHAALKQYEQSNRLLQQCARKAISENATGYYTLLGENMAAMTRYSQAQQYYDTARYLSGSPMLLYRKALTYEAAHQEQKAKAAYATFLKRPGDADTALIRYARSRVGDK